MRSCRSASFGSFISVEVSCLETTAMSSALRPRRRERARQRRVGRAAPPARPSRPPGSSVHAVGEAAGVGEHAAHRQAERERHVAAHDEQRAPALGLDEAAAADVVGARGLVRRDAHRLEVVAGGGRAHVAEADQALGREVVEAAGEHGQRLAGADLVVRLLERDGRGRAGGDRVDHRPVGADEGLHGVGGDDVAERLLQAVGLALARRAGGRAAAGAATPSRPSRRPACWRRAPGGPRRAAPPASARRRRTPRRCRRG